MEELCSQFKVNSTPHHPKMNGAVEAANKNIKKILEKMSVTYRDWHKMLPFALYGYRISGTTPLSLVYGFEAVLPVEVDVPGWHELEVKYTSATMGTAAYNCVPVTTFFFALMSRTKKVNLKKASGIAKVGGSILCIAGVTVLAFYKGPRLGFEKLSISACGITFGQTFTSAIQSFFMAIAIERNPSQWKLAWNISLAAILYCGIFVIPIGTCLSSWVVKKKGPVFQAVTTPFNLIFTLIRSEHIIRISLGSIIGAVLLVLSLYSIMWGKKKEASHLDTENTTNSILIHA
ncbi:WAT1-related protein At1g43650-like [Cucumis melo]|uniref:WAT1-related protein At1g43650-like n=1 Tax=Cucumis melo TaxID=3656 RepID=A0ABM3L2W5_CUCME|nr:WAT1-related protein At1g43650-like [Cucumis melo]